ncbi:four helix bundle protein [Candidatus Gracilibacteria bacterium]|nr:four helix bundle protein [Candidatus Gracilibacteria bacterium]
MVKENIIMDKSFEFSINIIKLYKQLKDKKEFIISKQILRSGTSIGANLTESKFGSSKKDFLNKVSIALKEANETLYRLNLLEKSDLVDLDVSNYIKENNEIIAILVKIVNTTKANLNS